MDIHNLSPSLKLINIHNIIIDAGKAIKNAPGTYRLGFTLHSKTDYVKLKWLKNIYIKLYV